MADRTAIINVVGLTGRVLGAHTPHLTAAAQAGGMISVEPVLPALTCSAQSTYLTGTPPSAHGIVGNGWFDRDLAEHLFWKQSNHLVRGEKLWDRARGVRPGFTCAKLFWWYNMYSSADWSITPRPLYLADGRKVFDIHSRPASLREQIQRDLGRFPFAAFWGPLAGLASSEWIAQAARWVDQRHRPDLSLVYLPHLDYNLQRLGPDDPRVTEDYRAVDAIVGGLLAFYREQGVQPIILSEYGITKVTRALALNRMFRARGWIAVKEELGHELLDCGASRAFAIADHQVAHVYVNDPSLLSEVRATLERVDGVATVLDAAGKASVGLDHPRAGDLVVFSHEDAWFTYYYWDDDRKAPDFARCVDIHRKYGYDPAELFFDPGLRLPQARVLWTLLRRALGFRALMNVIPLDAGLVRGSHGVRPADELDWPVLIGTGSTPNSLPATSVHDRLLATCLRSQ